MSEQKQENRTPAEKIEASMAAAQNSKELPTEQEITNVLMVVEDPELHINIIELGLIYKIVREPEAGRITVDMTLTTPACPYGPQLLAQTHSVLSRLPNVKQVKINTVWSPKWDPRTHATEVAQMMLGLI